MSAGLLNQALNFPVSFCVDNLTSNQGCIFRVIVLLIKTIVCQLFFRSSDFKTIDSVMLLQKDLDSVF